MSRGGICLRTLFNPAHLFDMRVCVGGDICVYFWVLCGLDCDLGRMSFWGQYPTHRAVLGRVGTWIGTVWL